MQIEKIPHFKLLSRQYSKFKGLFLLKISLILLLLLSTCENKSVKGSESDEFLLVPTPAKILKRSGDVTFDNNFWVITDVSDTSSAWLGKYLVNEIDKIPGLVATIADLYSTRKHEQGIIIEKIEDPAIHPQGYSLDLTSRLIKVQSVSDQGLYNGVNTVLGLLGRTWDNNSKRAIIRKAVIKDQPFYKTRALHLSGKLDSLVLKKMLNAASQLKFNSIYLSPNVSGIVDQPYFEDYQFVILSDRDLSSANQVMVSDDQTQWQDLFARNIDNGSGSVVIKLDNYNKAVNPYQLFVASQLSWYGPTTKGYDLLKKTIDESVTDYP